MSWNPIKLRRQLREIQAALADANETARCFQSLSRESIAREQEALAQLGLSLVDTKGVTLRERMLRQFRALAEMDPINNWIH
jgi:hypothetical protein